MSARPALFFFLHKKQIIFLPQSDESVYGGMTPVSDRTKRQTKKSHSCSAAKRIEFENE